MSRKIKLSILTVFLITILLNVVNIPIVYAKDVFECKAFDTKDLKCRDAEGKDKNQDGIYWETTKEENSKYQELFEDGKCKGAQCYKQINIEECLREYGEYDVKDLVYKAISISKQLLGIVGSVALLFFIIAGIQMIFSGGSEEKIKSARTMMVQTIIGLVIFLGAYMIISFVQDTLIEKAEEDKNFKLESTEFK